MKIMCIIVVYNKDVMESSTLNFLLSKKIHNVRICVVDNSTQKNNNEKVAIQNSWIYLTEHRNMGLSAAYNKAIDYCNKKTDTDYYLMLDDDAILDIGYFDYISSLLRQSNIEIGVPVIKSGRDMLSPCRVTLIGRITKAKDVKREKNISAINNGMLINRNVFSKVKYNEKLFLDYVDHDFIRAAKGKNIDITVLDYTLQHNMSIADGKIPKSSRLNRFKIYSKDLKEYFSKSLIEKSFCKIHLIGLGLRYSIAYKDGSFLKMV